MGAEVLCLPGLIIAIVLALYVYFDANNRGLDSGGILLWTLLTFFLSLIGFIIYILVRPSGDMATCHKCQKSVLKTSTHCPHCGNPARPPVQQQPVQYQQPRPVQYQQPAQPRPAPAPVPQPQQRPVPPAEKKCPHCQKKVDPGWTTCPYCSKKIEKEKTIIDEVFLIYRDGRLIKHFTRRIKPDVDQDILSGMLTAVQDFIKDSFRGETGELDEMKFGRFQILMGRGRFITIAAVMYGDEVKPFRPQITKVIDDIEGDYEVMLRDWNGEIEKLTVLGRYINDLIDGRYA